MKKQKLLYLLLGLSLIPTGCKKSNDQDINIETGDIKEVELEQNEDTEKEEKMYFQDERLTDLYSDDENRDLYIPKDFIYTDEKNKIKYKRKNIPEYGISALIPEGFKPISNVDINKNNFASMVSLYGNTEKTKGIQISFYARPELTKGKNFIQRAFYKDIMDNYSHVYKNDIYKLNALKLNDLEEKYSDEDVYISNINNDYVEMVNPTDGFDNVKGKKLLRWTEKAQEFRMMSKEGAATRSLLTFINYGIVFDEGVITIVNCQPGQEELAEDINNVIAESIAYADIEQNTLIFDNSTREDEIIKGRKLVVAKNLVPVTTTSYSKLYMIDNPLEDNAVMKPTFLFAFYQKVQPNSPDILQHFKGLENFKVEFANRFYNRRKGDKTGPLSLSETEHYYRSGAAISEGYYATTVNKVQDEGIYKAIYFEDTGEIYVLMMNSDKFTEKIKEKELARIIDKIR